MSTSVGVFLKHCVFFGTTKLFLYFFILVERFHLHLKVVVGGRGDDIGIGERHDNLSMISGSISKSDNIWIHIESRQDRDDSLLNNSNDDDIYNNNNNNNKVLETPQQNLALKFPDQSKDSLAVALSQSEPQTIVSNTSEIRVVRKTESVSEKKTEKSVPKNVSNKKADKSVALDVETPTTKQNFDDYKVAGWPPEVSRNVSAYIDFENKNSSLLKPRLGPILSKSKMGSWRFFLTH